MKSSAVTMAHSGIEWVDIVFNWCVRLLYDWAAGGDEGLRWQGFSLGPGLRRLSHIRALGDLETYGSEIHVQAAFKSFGLWAAAL